MSKELLKEAFILSHVQSIWLTPNGDFYLHPVKGAKQIKRGDHIDSDDTEKVEEVKKPTKKK